MASPLELVEAVLVLFPCPVGEVRGDRRGDFREGGTEDFLSGEGENRPPLLDDTLGFFSSEPLPVEDFLLLSKLSFSLLGGFRGELGSLLWGCCCGSYFTRGSAFTCGACGSVLTGPGLNVFEKDGLDWEKLGMKLEELESSPNKSLKSLTEGSALGLKLSVSVLTGMAGREGTGGRGRRGRLAPWSGRSKSEPNRSCCNLDGGGASSDSLLPPVEQNPRIDCKDLLSSLALGGGTVGLEE